MSQNVYSTTERVVGTWIDGKPIYQRTFSGTAGSSRLYTLVDGDSFNMSKLIEAKGNIDSEENQTWIFPVNNSGTKSANVYVNKGTNEIMFVLGDSMYNKTFDITIRYTKTTD